MMQSSCIWYESLQGHVLYLCRQERTLFAKMYGYNKNEKNSFSYKLILIFFYILIPADIIINY